MSVDVGAGVMLTQPHATCGSLEECPKVMRAGELPLPLMPAIALRIVDHIPHLSRTLELVLIIGLS